jgi:hypothetical protein
MIGIDKRPLQPSRKLAANRGFSRSRHADEVDVVRSAHGLILACRIRTTIARRTPWRTREFIS